MVAIGAKIRWQEGKILHPSRFWKTPSRRRIPRLLIENRALEVGILVYIKEPWVFFQETELKADQIDTKDATILEIYKQRYHMLPEKFKRQDAYKWLNNSGNALLLWGKENRYFIIASKRPSSPKT